MSAVSAAAGVPLLRVDGLRKAFGGVRAVDGVSFELAPGELLALIGPNGAGKSTCFNCINGQLRPDAGRVLLDGRDLVGKAPREIWRMGVGRTFQIAATWSSMTVAENVQLALLSHAGQLRRWWGRAAAMHRDEALALLGDVGLAEAADAPCAALAYGDVKRLVRERGIGVLFTEHSMDVVFAHADRLIVLARGELIAEGPPDAIRDDARVREVYFGSTGVPRAARVEGA